MKSLIEEFQDEEREKKSDIVITIDGKAAAGKGTIAENVAELIDVEHFSASDFFYQIAEERGLEDFELSEKAEKEVDVEIDRRTLERGLEKNCVIEGRIPSYALGSYSDFRIKVEADQEERASRLMEREGISMEEARDIVRKRDERDAERYRKYYGIDLEDREIYDLIIENTDLGIEEQNKHVEKALKKGFPERIELK